MNSIIKFPKRARLSDSKDQLDLDILNFETAMIEITKWMLDGGELPPRFTSDEHGIIVEKNKMD